MRTRNKIKKSVDEGLEPPQQEPESRVLPLHQSTIKWCVYNNKFLNICQEFFWYIFSFIAFVFIFILSFYTFSAASQHGKAYPIYQRKMNIEELNSILLIFRRWCRWTSLRHRSFCRRYRLPWWLRRLCTSKSWAAFVYPAFL